MQNLREYGFSVMTLTDMVDDFCLAQNNMRESNIPAQYRHARWAWKELFRTTLWNIRKAVLCVDCKDHTIRIPADCERVIAISVVDCYGIIHPLSFNSDRNATRIKCLKSKCSCTRCNGEDTLCSAIDSIAATTNTIYIHDVAYTQTILTRYDGSGAVQTQTTTPTWDVSSQSVINIVQVETLCNVETTETGCIKITEANMGALRTRLGVGNFLDFWNNMGYSWGNKNAYYGLIPATYNYWGEWNYNSADRQIIHIFGTGATQINHYNNTPVQENEWRNSLRQVILDYQTNGETPDTEILIPEYAVEQVQTGMFYRQKKLNPRAGSKEREDARCEWVAAQREVAKYLNPIIMENVAKLQTNPRHW